MPVPKDGEPRQRATTRRSLSLDTSGGANQADAAGADIHKMWAQYKRTGTVPGVARMRPLQGDFTFPEDIHSMREAVLQAEDEFMALPAQVRAAARNDWVEFIGMTETPQGRATLEKAGLTWFDNGQQNDPTNQAVITDPQTDPDTSVSVPVTEAEGGA